jgi:hypothetical protein
MDFKMVEGYVSPEFPPGYRSDPFFGKLISEQVGAQDVEGLRDFLDRRQVTAIVIEAKDPGPWPFLLAAMKLTPVKTGGVLFYRVGAQV